MATVPEASPLPQPSPRRRNDRRDNKRKNKNPDKIALDVDNDFRVHVTGFPPYTKVEDLKQEFATYGVLNVKLIRNFAIVTLANAASTKRALEDSKKLCVYGGFLTVKPYTAPTEQPKHKRVFVRSKEKNVIIEPSKIELSGEFPQQLASLLAAVRLTEQEVAGMSRLFEDLESVLGKLWPGCRAVPFGSITTGLGIKTSDADCFVDIPPHYRDPSCNYVNKTKRLLQTYPKIFTEILSIPHAHTPIVKFFYAPSNTNCDVSFKNPLGTRNSRLIAFLLHVDPRLVPVAVAIKYWAKVHGITGGGKLSNYALTMLLLYFLQQPEVAILPPIASLQRDPSAEDLIDGWNTGFVDRHDLVPKTENESPIADLLGQFFAFYANFNFEEFAVCPLLGRPIKKTAFAELASLPQEMGPYKANVASKVAAPINYSTAMCVQDPLELSHNVASSMSLRLAAELKAYFKFAADAYQKDKDNRYENFLKIILLQKPVLPAAKACTEFRARVRAKEFHQMSTDAAKDLVRNVLHIMFDRICLAKLERGVDDKTDDSKKNVEEHTCTVTKPVWKRKRFTKIYNHMQGSFLDKQIRISNEIIKVDKEKHNLKINLSVAFSAETKGAHVLMKLVEGDKSVFQEFGKFFIVMINGWFFVLMRPFLKNNGESEAGESKQIDLTNGEVREDESGDPEGEANDGDRNIGDPTP